MCRPLYCFIFSRCFQILQSLLFSFNFFRTIFCSVCSTKRISKFLQRVPAPFILYLFNVTYETRQDFFSNFLNFLKGSCLQCFRYFATEWLLKKYKESPSLNFFGTMILVKIVIFRLILGLVNIDPSNFFQYYQTYYPQ